ncbi:MAG: cytochrome c-type biogenesis protein CcmH [Chloroflexi bacterium]|nr:cytochrome c-type biogenesis protein CcmH [Chloroflexota bacterium]
MARVIRIVALIAGLLLLAAPIEAAEVGSVDDVARELMCQCGCTMIVYNCDCGTADQMRGLIREKLDGGQTKQQILDYFVGQYGETVLAAPTKEGFNITAWIMPFVGLVVGIGVVYFVMTRWLLASSRPQEMAVVSDEEELSEYEDRFLRELRQYEGRS